MDEDFLFYYLLRANVVIGKIKSIIYLQDSSYVHRTKIEISAIATVEVQLRTRIR